MRLVKLIQDWVPLEVCDRCGRSLPAGEEIYVDIDSPAAEAGILPAYCRRCAEGEGDG